MSKRIRHNTIRNIQYFSVCLFFASLNFEMFSPIIPDFSVAKMAAFLYMAVSLLTFKKLFSIKNISIPLCTAFLMFFLMVLSSIIHLQRNRSIFDTTLFLNILMFWLLLNHYRRDKRVFQGGLLWFAVSSFVVGLCYFMNIGVTIDASLRVVVFGENANNLGVKMGVGTLVLLNYCLAHSPERPIYKPWLLVLTIPMISLLLSTASRLAILVLASGAILFVLFRYTMTKTKKIIWLIIGLFALFYGYRIVLKQDVLMARMENTIEEGNVSGRDYIWEKYFDLIEEYPILGVGFTGAEQYALSVFGKPRSPHNVLIEVAVYSGVLGLSCFLMFLLCVFRDGYLYRKRLLNIGPLIVYMAIIGMVMSGQALGVKLFWALAAYAISYRIETKVFLEEETIE